MPAKRSPSRPAEPARPPAKGAGRAKAARAEEPRKETLRGLGRSFAILEFVAAAPRRVVDVTRDLDLPWATAHRTMTQLEKSQFLRRDEDTGRYEIGPRLWYIGSAYLANHRVLKIAAPLLARLEGVEGVAMQIVERVGEQSVAIYSHQRVDEDITKAHFGYHFPLHCGSKGLVLLANEKPEFIEAYLAKPLQQLTNETITSAVEIRKALEAVRKDDFSLTLGDVQPFTGSISAPIRETSGKVIAAVCFVFRKTLARDGKKLEALRERLIRTAQSISIDLGWRPGNGRRA